MANKYAKATQAANVTITTSATKVFENGAPPNGRSAISIPLHNLAGYLFLLVTPTNGLQRDGSTAIDATYIQNWGTRWEAADKVAQVLVADECDVFACTSTGSFVAYPSEWFQS